MMTQFNLITRQLGAIKMSTRNDYKKVESGIKSHHFCINRWQLSEGLCTDPGWGGNQTFCKCQTGGRLQLTAEQIGGNQTVLTIKLATETLDIYR